MITSAHPDNSVDVQFVPPAPGQLVLNLPPAATIAMNRVMADTGDSPGEVFRKALGLYMLALDAKSRGKSVGAADSPEMLETEFTGF